MTFLFLLLAIIAPKPKEPVKLPEPPKPRRYIPRDLTPIEVQQIKDRSGEPTGVNP